MALRPARHRHRCGRATGTPLTELIPTFSGPGRGARLSPGGYHDFEHRWALSEAFAFHERIGRDRVVARTVEQATALKEGLAGIDGITVVTPADPEVSAGIVCVDVRGMLPANAVMELREAGDRRQRHAVPAVLPAARPEHRHLARGGRPAVAAVAELV